MTGYRFDVVTLFPEFFPGPLSVGLVGRAFRDGRAEVGYVDPRDFTQDRHRTVDDRPYGGGAGMVMAVEPLAAAIAEVRARGPGPVVLLGPAGRPVRQADFVRWAEGRHLGLVAGRYEGFDERVAGLVDEQVSLGDFVLTGGEPAALAVIDGVARLLPGTLGNAGSAMADSFSDGLLEHPQYTRPDRCRFGAVPDVLLEGDHARVFAWRRRLQLERTRAERPDLLEAVRLGDEDRRTLAERPPSRRVRLVVGLPSPDPLAIEQLARLALAFGLELVVAVGEDVERLVEAAPPIVQLGLPGPRRRDRPPRLERPVSELVQAARDWPQARALIGEGPVRVGVRRRPTGPCIDPAQARLAAGRGAGLCLGLGPADDFAAQAELPALRQGTEAHDLGPVLAAALALDRVLGEG